jgi:hypothetical protein
MKDPVTLQGWEARQRIWKRQLKDLERSLSFDRRVADTNSVIITGLTYVMRDRMITSRYQRKIRYTRRRLQKWADVLHETYNGCTRLKSAKPGECIWCGKTECVHLNPKPILEIDVGVFKAFRLVHSDYEASIRA